MALMKEASATLVKDVLQMCDCEASRLKMLRDFIVPFCISGKSGSLQTRRSMFAHACGWAIESITRASALKIDQKRGVSGLRLPWLSPIRSILANAPEISMSEPCLHQHPIMKALAFWTDTGNEAIRRATTKMIQNISDWTNRSAGARYEAAQVEVLYEAIQAFYLAMLLCVQPKWIKAMKDTHKQTKHTRSCRSYLVPTQMARFVISLFPMAIVAPVLASIESIELRSRIIHIIKTNLERYGKYITPLVATCASFIGWMTPLLSPCVARQANKTDSNIDAFVLSISTKNSKFWKYTETKCRVFRMLTSKYARERISFVEHHQDEWAVYAWIKSFSIMSQGDAQKRDVCTGFVSSTKCLKLWGMYTMMRDEAVELKCVISGPQTRPFDAALRTADAILAANQWIDQKSISWVMTYTAAVKRLASRLWNVRSGRIMLRERISDILPPKGISNIVFEYTCPRQQRKMLHVLIKRCVRVLAFMHYNRFDSRFIEAQRALLKSILLYNPCGANNCAPYSKLELSELKKILASTFIADQVARYLVSGF